MTKEYIFASWWFISKHELLVICPDPIKIIFNRTKTQWDNDKRPQYLGDQSYMLPPNKTHTSVLVSHGS